MYGDTYSKSMDQPGKVTSPARGQLNKECEYSPVLVSRDGFDRPVPLNMVLTRGNHTPKR